VSDRVPPPVVSGHAIALYQGCRGGRDSPFAPCPSRRQPGGLGDDVAAVNALQDQFAIEANSATPFEMPEYETASLDATRKALATRHAGSS
jgi:hypothetical protein